MRKVIRGKGQAGFKVVRENLQATLGGASFGRTDFKRDIVYEAVLVKSCDREALVLIFTASDRNSVDNLIATTDLKLDAVRSGCTLEKN